MDHALLDKALTLPVNDRVLLAELILESIDNEDEDIRRAWIAEVGRRMKDVEEGRFELLAFDDLYKED